MGPLNIATAAGDVNAPRRATNANLHSADFNGADLSRSDLRNCKLGAADFGSSRLVDSMVDGAYGKIFGPIDMGDLRDAAEMAAGKGGYLWFRGNRTSGRYPID